MDAFLPVVSGLKVLCILKADPELCEIPVLLATDEKNEQERDAGIELGACDYITRPFKVLEIQQSIRNSLRLAAADKTFSTRNRDTKSFDLARRADALHQLYICLDYEFTRAVRYRHPLGCIAVRVANREELSRSVGESQAEASLAVFIAELRRSIRGIDHLFHYAAWEFAVVLPETDQDGCRTVLERLNRSVADFSPSTEATTPKPRVAAAIAVYPKCAVKDGRELFAKAVEAVKTPS